MKSDSIDQSDAPLWRRDGGRLTAGKRATMRVFAQVYRRMAQDAESEAERASLLRSAEWADGLGAEPASPVRLRLFAKAYRAQAEIEDNEAERHALIRLAKRAEREARELAGQARPRPDRPKPAF